MARAYLIVLHAILVTGAAADEKAPVTRWLNDAESAAAEAGKTSLPILFVLTPENRAEDALPAPCWASLDDSRVRRIVTHAFVATRLQPSLERDLLLKQLDAVGAENGTVIVTTPGGRRVAVLAPEETFEAVTLADRLAEAYRSYADDRFEKKLKPVLEADDQRNEKELLDALKQVAVIRPARADHLVIRRLEQEDIRAAVREQAYTTLAALSTEPAAEALLVRAGEDEAAARALRACTPAGAEILVAGIQPDRPAQRVIAYQAAAAVCGLPDVKPPDFWTGDDPAAQEAEIERLRKRVAKAAASYREEYFWLP